ncbi:MAG: glycosyltransferase [Alphaproteobacteria bacterium]
MIDLATLLSILGLLAWCYLALFHGHFWKVVLPAPSPQPTAWPSVDIIVPARNEALSLPQTLPSLLKQDYPGLWRVILVDDHSEDGTSAIAQQCAADTKAQDKLIILAAPDLAQGWSGKVAAMNTATTQSDADYILFTDADIAHTTSSLRELVARAQDKKHALTSLMVKLNCTSFAEKLLVPAFVYFFAMLYPFAKANNPTSKVAAAAGGVMLVQSKALKNIGGLQKIKSALIDDCSLARAIKDFGGDDGTPASIELTHTNTVKSLRIYPEIKDIWRMVARTAFTQLQMSPILLIGTVLGMSILFLLPILFILSGTLLVTVTSFITCMIMIGLYVPMIRFYNLPLTWALTLPIAALIYIGATIDSARLYWQGKGGQWKGRAQAS